MLIDIHIYLIVYPLHTLHPSHLLIYLLEDGGYLVYIMQSYFPNVFLASQRQKK